MTGTEADGRWIDKRYRVIRRLGQGGMGSVYLVADRRRDDELLALKTVPREDLDGRSLAVLRNEFLSLSTVRHPNVVEVYDFGVDRETSDLFFTFEFIEGCSWLAAANQLDINIAEGLDTFLDVLCQVLRALEFVHSRGMVHADIKPDNILVSGIHQDGTVSTDPPKAKLIDFGLAKQENSQGGEKILGTPYYVAPETILGARADRRTDLYSLGVVLYHLLTGCVPFTGDSNLTILKSHVEKDPVDPRELNRALPPGLCAIVMRLLRKRPEDRVQSAVVVIDEINRSLGKRFSLETSDTLNCYLEAASIVGREKDIADLQTVFLATAGADDAVLPPSEDLQLHSQSQLAAGGYSDDRGELTVRGVLTRGERGLGKKRLTRKLRTMSQTYGARFVAIDSGGEDDADFVSLVTELEELDADEAENAPTYVRRARKFVEDGQANFSGRREKEKEEVLTEVAFGILTRTREQPMVLHCNDLHRGGPLLLELIRRLVEIQSRRGGMDGRLLLSGTALDQAAVQRTAFDRLCKRRSFRSNFLELRLRRLSREDTEALVHAVFPGNRFPGGFFDMVADESDGNPETVVDILGFFVDRGKLSRTVEGWVLRGDYATEEVPGRARRELRAQISRLPAEALRLAEAFACLQEACDVEFAEQLIGAPRRQLERDIEVLCGQNILRESKSQQESLFGFAQPGARAMIYRMTAASERAYLHERAAVLYEKQQDDGGKRNVHGLAYHYLRSANREKAIQYGREAALELEGDSEPREAIAIYEQVLGLCEEDGGGPSNEVKRRIAALQFLVGEYASSLDILGQLREPAAEIARGDRASLYLDAARAHGRLGQFDEAERQLSGVAGCWEGTEPETASTEQEILARAELRFLQGKLVESLRECVRLTATREQVTDKSVLAQALMLQAENYFLLNDRDSAGSYCQLATRLLDGQRDPRLLAESLFCRGKAYSYKYQLPNAIKQFRLCLLLRQKIGLLDGQADCLRELGNLYHMLGSLGEARSYLERAQELYEKSGNFAGRVRTLSRLSEVLRLLGENDKCQDAMREVLGSVGATEKRRVRMHTLLTFAAYCIDHGMGSDAQRYLDKARSQRSHGAATTLGSERIDELASALCFQTGDMVQGLEYAARGMISARQNGNPVALAGLLIQQCQAVCKLGPSGEGRRLLVSLFDLTKRHGLGVAEGWGRLLEAMLLSKEQQQDKAERAFGRAVDLLSAHGGERDLASAYLERGLFFLARKNYEQAYLNLEEGYYLARKLELAYLQCRYALAVGLLETALSDAHSCEAERGFLRARETAGAHGFLELRWQIERELANLFLRAERVKEAEELLGESLKSLRELLPKVPPLYRKTYSTSHQARELKELLAAVQQLLPSAG